MDAPYGAVAVIELRDPDDGERALTCNGCRAPTVVKVLEVGTRNAGRDGGSTTLFRACHECLRKLREEVAP